MVTMVMVLQSVGLPAEAIAILLPIDRILDSLRTVVKMALSRACYEVLEAADGLEGLARLDEGTRVNLVVSDVNMPRMDGIAFLKQVKQHPRYKFTPVIMLTTESSQDRIAEGRAAGAKAWVVKPFQPPQLLDAVAKLVLP